MTRATFICRKSEPAFVAMTCRQTADRYTAVRAGGEWFCYTNECRQVNRPTRREALAWIESEANITLP